MNIIQIGANKGNDDLTQIIGNNQPNILVLVEPMKLHNQDLLNNYSWVINLHIENIVIETETGKEVDFFYHVNDGPKYEVASLIREHIFPRHPNLDNQGITSFKITTMNINDLFQKYGLKIIDVLFIDAEGFDDTIIFSIDFERYDIKKLYFENLHIKNKTVYEYLESKGFRIEKNIGLYGWSSMAEKLI
jgi:FkbM family methyltransferase